MEAHRIIAIVAAAIWLVVIMAFFVSCASAFSHHGSSSSMANTAVMDALMKVAFVFTFALAFTIVVATIFGRRS